MDLRWHFERFLFCWVLTCFGVCLEVFFLRSSGVWSRGFLCLTESSPSCSGRSVTILVYRGAGRWVKGKRPGGPGFVTVLRRGSGKGGTVSRKIHWLIYGFRKT